MPELVGKDGERIAFDDEISKVSVVGVGMRSHAGIAKTMFQLLAAGEHQHPADLDERDQDLAA